MRSIRQAENRAIATVWQDAAAIIRAPCTLITIRERTFKQFQFFNWMLFFY